MTQTDVPWLGPPNVPHSSVCRPWPAENSWLGFPGHRGVVMEKIIEVNGGLREFLWKWWNMWDVHGFSMIFHDFPSWITSGSTKGSCLEVTLLPSGHLSSRPASVWKNRLFLWIQMIHQFCLKMGGCIKNCLLENHGPGRGLGYQIVRFAETLDLPMPGGTRL